MSDATAVLGFSEVTLGFLSGSGGLTEISLFNSLCYDFLSDNIKGTHAGENDSHPRYSTAFSLFCSNKRCGICSIP